MRESRVSVDVLEDRRAEESPDLGRDQEGGRTVKSYPVKCHCGCFGDKAFHEAGERVRREMLVDRPAERSMPVVVGKKTTRAGFGLRAADIGIEVEA